MNKDNKDEQKPSIKISPAERGIALTMALAVLITFIFLVLNPRAMDNGTLAIVRFLAATFAGIAGYIFTGLLHLEGQIPFLNAIQIKAGGSFAAFVLVLLIFFVGIPSEEEPLGYPRYQPHPPLKEWITYEPIPNLDELINNFKLPTGEKNLNLKFVTSGWNFELPFTVSENYQTLALAKSLFTHFSFRNYISFDMSQFPSAPGCVDWEQEWLLTANGRYITTIYGYHDRYRAKPKFDELTLDEIEKSDSGSLIDDGLNDGDLLNIKFNWMTECQTAPSFGRDPDAPRPRRPPNTEL